MKIDALKVDVERLRRDRDRARRELERGKAAAKMPLRKLSKDYA